MQLRGKLSRFPGNVFEVLEATNDYESNLKMIKRIIKMGHKSIIEHDYLVFGICDVTPIIEQTIIGARLSSFTIKSRREVDFRTAGFYIPKFRDKSGEELKEINKITERYKQHMKYLFNSYANIVDLGISKEDARFILPYCYHSNIIMGIDARQLEKMIISFTKGNLSKIQELKEFGEKMLEIANKYVPYLIPSLENYSESFDNGFEFLEENSERPKIKIIDSPQLISYTSNCDEVIIQSYIMYHYQCSKEQAIDILMDLEKKDKDVKNKLMQIILHKEERRELEQTNFTFQIPISLSILTHLTRHRMQSLLIPEFLPLWDLKNYIIPDTIKNNPKTLEIYQEAINKNIEIFEELKEYIYDEDMIYFYLGCQMLNVITTMNSRTLQWISRMRCCNKAQWQIRQIVWKMVNEVKKVAPLLGEGLGPTCMTEKYCGEGKESCGLIDRL